MEDKNLCWWLKFSSLISALKVTRMPVATHRQWTKARVNEATGTFDLFLETATTQCAVQCSLLSYACRIMSAQCKARGAHESAPLERPAFCQKLQWKPTTIICSVPLRHLPPLFSRRNTFVLLCNNNYAFQINFAAMFWEAREVPG